MPRGKIPTKAELIQLQRLYKTDEKIAERLGAITPQLVAYWRRKKNIPRHSFPKFSESEIREVWERFGDDYRCGLELGISKAAFYNWRRKYGHNEKPAFLKLEQLELNLGGPSRTGIKKLHYGRQTIAQKILANSAGLDKVEAEEIVTIEPDLAISNNNAASIIGQFKENGLSYIWNPNRVIISLDDNAVSGRDDIRIAHKTVRDFIKRQNIKNFYDIREGTGHQLIIETGHLLPGQLAIGTDIHTTAYGCIGAFAADIPLPDMAAVWASGKINLKVPRSIKVIINGKLSRGVYARDVILFIIKNLAPQGIDYGAAEFCGTVPSQMSISERFTLSYHAAEMGVNAAICPFDSITRRFFLGRTKMPYRPALADKDAFYDQTFEFNVNQLPPQIYRPGDTHDITTVAEIAGLPINQVIIGSCANGRFDDLRVVADVIKGKKIHPDVRLLIYPSSRSVYLEALKKGLIRAFIEAGAVVMNPGCGPCLGSPNAILAPGERCLSTAGRNQSVMTELADSEIYYVSPATAAISAVKGVITDPTGYAK